MPNSYPDNVRRQAIRLYVDGLSIREVSDRLGMSAGTVYNWVRSEGVHRGRRGTPPPDQSEIDRAAFLYRANPKATLVQVGKIMGISDTTVMQYLRLAGVKTRGRNGTREIPQKTRELAVDLYRLGHTNQQIADELGISKTSVGRFIAASGAPKRQGEIRKLSHRKRSEKQKKAMARRLRAQRCTYPDICRITGASPATVYKYCRGVLPKHATGFYTKSKS